MSESTGFPFIMLSDAARRIIVEELDWAGRQSTFEMGEVKFDRETVRVTCTRTTPDVRDRIEKRLAALGPGYIVRIEP